MSGNRSSFPFVKTPPTLKHELYIVFLVLFKQTFFWEQFLITMCFKIVLLRSHYGLCDDKGKAKLFQRSSSTWPAFEAWGKTELSGWQLWQWEVPQECLRHGSFRVCCCHQLGSSPSFGMSASLGQCSGWVWHCKRPRDPCSHWLTEPSSWIPAWADLWWLEPQHAKLWGLSGQDLQEASFWLQASSTWPPEVCNSTWCCKNGSHLQSFWFADVGVGYPASRCFLWCWEAWCGCLVREAGLWWLPLLFERGVPCPAGLVQSFWAVCNPFQAQSIGGEGWVFPFFLNLWINHIKETTKDFQ